MTKGTILCIVGGMLVGASIGPTLMQLIMGLTAIPILIVGGRIK